MTSTLLLISFPCHINFCPVSTSGSLTSHNIVTKKATIDCIGLEQRLYIIFSLLMLFFIYIKSILHNDVKSDNILVVKNVGFYTPILVDVEQSRYQKEQSRYQKEHFNISPEVINGTE